MGLRIIAPGLLTTIQDRGRWGFRKEGVIVSGAMDTLAFRIGNILLGNKENEAALEATLTGPEILFEENVIIAITGADLSPQINGQAVQLWRPVFIKRGSTLSFGRPKAGCRSYIAVAGGLDVPEVLKSASTYLRAGLGGWKGRALRAGDVIPTKKLRKNNVSLLQSLENSVGEASFVQARWTHSPYLYPNSNHSPIIRAVAGPEYNWFSEDSHDAFWQKDFSITPQSDRMGARLKGGTLVLKEKRELLSAAVTFGTIQVPADGNPIILMADHPTIGGYPRIAQLASVDLPLLAQIPPSKMLKFQKISLQEAQQLFYKQEQHINLLKTALQLRIGRKTE